MPTVLIFICNTYNRYLTVRFRQIKLLEYAVWNCAIVHKWVYSLCVFIRTIIMNLWMSKILATYYLEVNISKLTNYHNLIPVLEVKARISYSNKFTLKVVLL